MPNYLEPTHPDAFIDFPKLNKPDHGHDYIECPKCFGHGGWNLAINAYPMRNCEDTPENRHKYKHFRSSCSQCNSWGWLHPDKAKCIHDLTWSKNVGRCLNEYKCLKCDHTEVWDSSD